MTELLKPSYNILTFVIRNFSFVIAPPVPIRSLNPTTAEVLQNFTELSNQEIELKLQQAATAFSIWKKTSFAERTKLMLKLAEILRSKKEDLGKIITLEMGKPIRESFAEIEKCATCCEYFAENAEKFLAEEQIATDAARSFVRCEPMGIILAVMPWNFPFWQVIRFIAPAAMAGNVGVLKHASNVPQCALALEEIFTLAGFPDGVFQSLLISSDQVPALIRDDRVKAVTLTGSEHAGIAVAKEAGASLKKTLLELGGSNPFLVLADADIDLAVSAAVKGRFQNCGQSCIAAKRFLVAEKIAAEFLEKFIAATKKLVVGDPLKTETDIGPLASKNILEDLEKQVSKSVEMGAELLLGGKRLEGKGYFYAPTILGNVTPEMPVFAEETFGPVAAVTVVKDIDEAIRLANQSRFGLGAAVCTQSKENIARCIAELHTSAVFVNGIVKSDPRLPFGGIEKSGYGRELSHYGIKEFVNVKTVWVR